MKTPRLFCFAHRGASGYEPENTLRAVCKALELGADGVEVDVWRTGDEVVAIHDRRLRRTTNGSGFVERKSLAELRLLDAGKGEVIPTLAEVFDVVDRRAIVNVELKGPGLSEPVADLIASYVTHRSWSDDDFLVSSFDHAELARFRELRPQTPVGLLIKSVPRSLAAGAEQFGAVSIHVRLARVTQALVDDAHRRGLKVFVYTVNRPADIARMRELGVDGVFSDFPDRVVSD